MTQIKIDNYVLTTPVLDILYTLRTKLTNGKLKDIEYRQGKDNITVTCPHHSGGHENKPAGQIYVGEDGKVPYGFYSCFVCGFAGPFETFVAECMDSSVDYAKKWLIDNFGEMEYETPVLDNYIKLKNTMYSSGGDMVDSSVLDTYQKWCPYFAQRKLSMQTCEKFGLRYDPEYRTVIFPCRDMYGDLVMLPTRSVDTKVFHLDPRVKKPVYCLDYIMKNNISHAIITEGPFDCLTSYEYGYPAVATLGAMSDDQIDQLNHSCIRVLYTMFDNDAAGRRFTEKLKAKLNKRILVETLQIPAGKKDINDLSREEFKNILETHNVFPERVV